MSSLIWKTKLFCVTTVNPLLVGNQLRLQNCQVITYISYKLIIYLDALGNDEDEKVFVASDLESILTFYCKTNKLKYSSSNGWLEILRPMMALKLDRPQLYNCFSSFVDKFITR